MIGALASLRLRSGRDVLVLTVVSAGLCLSQWWPGRTDAPLIGCLLAVILVWVSLIDLERMVLPDLLTLPLVLMGLAWTWLTAPQALAEHLIGAALGYGALAGLAFAYRRLAGRDGLGLGDAKLLAAAGAWLGWSALPLVLLIASGSGLLQVLWQSRAGAPRQASIPLGHAIPFGPHLAAGFWGVWLFGNPFG